MDKPTKLTEAAVEQITTELHDKIETDLLKLHIEQMHTLFKPLSSGPKFGNAVREGE